VAPSVFAVREQVARDLEHAADHLRAAIASPRARLTPRMHADAIPGRHRGEHYAANHLPSWSNRGQARVLQLARNWRNRSRVIAAMIGSAMIERTIIAVKDAATGGPMGTEQWDEPEHVV